MTTPWSQLTHVSAGRPGLRVATRRGVFAFRRRDFEDAAAGPERVARAVRAGARLHAGGAGLAGRAATLDALASTPSPRRTTLSLAVVCLSTFALEVRWPELEQSGLFSATLVGLGEGWRLVTANLLHGSLAHLLVNLGGILMIGWLAERALGSAATALVLVTAGVGAMGASWLRGYEYALGASGLVYGLLGALLWLELRRPEALPASWRVPLGAFAAVVVLELGLALGASSIAFAAHWGGFLGGAAGAAWAGPRADAVGGRRRWLGRLLAASGFVVGLALVGWVGGALAPDPAALARRAERLLEEGEVSPQLLNNEAWRIAIAEDPGPEALGVARRLAERAVKDTGSRDPTVLDTLAEVLFQSGDARGALDVIDTAIALDPEEPYYREQRRRFTGERPADDRPAAPESLLPEPPLELPEPEGGGLSV